VAHYILDFADLTLRDVARVGGKTASLGEMFGALSSKGIRIPDGFAITADTYRLLIAHNHLEDRIRAELADIHEVGSSECINVQRLQDKASKVRELIKNAAWPDELIHELRHAYQKLSKQYGEAALSVAVRSSATAEDLPNASFAGQQETFLNVVGFDRLVDACRRCFASLFTDRAIVYRNEHDFDHFSVALSICIQKMVRSDLGSSGVMFTLDTETGFSQAMVINASYGLGEAIVQGIVTPDEYVVYKQPLAHGAYPIIQKTVGSKEVKIIYQDSPRNTHESTCQVAVSAEDQKKFALNDAYIQELARAGLVIEQHYAQIHGTTWMPMDIEWAIDGINSKLFIVQARPETVHHANVQERPTLKTYHLKDPSTKPVIMVTGQSVGQGVANGKARYIAGRDQLYEFEQGEILVTNMTDPDWVPIMKKARAIVTNIGGRTCHAAIVSRELGIPAIVGTEQGTQKLVTGQEITVDCSQGATGYVYEGNVPFVESVLDVKELPKIARVVMVNLADPEGAFAASLLPVAGVGLARLEFIINSYLGIHPMAVMTPSAVTDKQVLKNMYDRAAAYDSLQDFFINTLAQGVSMIAAAFYPRPVIVRLSDFKSNEYRNLLGGTYFEPYEENPMLGWRGASRYISKAYVPAFGLECAALKKARDEMGFSNIKLMIPFVRTVHEAEQTSKLLVEHGLVRGDRGLEVYMMVEIPSNVLLFEKFSHHFDGFSIGSNDLTQLTLGVDRDSGILHHIFDERDEAVKVMVKMALDGAKKVKKPIGICGQAPSDYPEIAEFLLDEGINSISLSVDAVLPFMLRYQKK